jgi:membrane protein EpsK
MRPHPTAAHVAKEETIARALRSPEQHEVDSGRGDGRACTWPEFNPEATVGSSNRAPSPTLTQVASNRFGINVWSNFGFVVLNTALMLWYLPFLVHHLGVATYGMISLANSLIMYASIISSGLDVSINRFLAIDINQGNAGCANRTFNTALVLSLAACAVLVVPAAIVTYFFPALFSVPPEIVSSTQFLFAGVAVATLAAILSGSFGAASLITHRFDLRNVVRAVTSLSRIGVVVLCFTFWSASLWYVAIGFIASACIGLTGDILVWRYLTPQLRIDPREIDYGQFRALLGLSGWTAVNQVGLLLLMQVDLLVVNVLFGAESTGLYGSLLLLANLIHMVVETIAVVLSPAIMAHYAVVDIAGMQRLAGGSLKLLGIGLALPIGLLCGFGRPLLSLWLGPDFAQLDYLLVLLIGHLAVNAAVRPLAYVLTAYNRVKLQALVTLGLGVANICLAIALARWAGWGMGGVAAAVAIVWTMRNAVFLTSYTAIVLNLRWWTFFPLLVGGALGVLGVAVVARVASQFCPITEWSTVAVGTVAIVVTYCVTAYTIGLNRADRDLLWSFLRVRSAS